MRLADEIRNCMNYIFEVFIVRTLKLKYLDSLQKSQDSGYGLVLCARLHELFRQRPQNVRNPQERGQEGQMDTNGNGRQAGMDAHEQLENLRGRNVFQ